MDEPRVTRARSRSMASMENSPLKNRIETPSPLSPLNIETESIPTDVPIRKSLKKKLSKVRLSIAKKKKDGDNTILIAPDSEPRSSKSPVPKKRKGNIATHYSAPSKALLRDSKHLANSPIKKSPQATPIDINDDYNESDSEEGEDYTPPDSDEDDEETVNNSNITNVIDISNVGSSEKQQKKEPAEKRIAFDIGVDLRELSSDSKPLKSPAANVGKKPKKGNKGKTLEEREAKSKLKNEVDVKKLAFEEAEREMLEDMKKMEEQQKVDKKKNEEEEARRKAFEEAEREMLEDMKRMEEQEKENKKKKEEEEARRKAFEEAEREMLEDMQKMKEIEEKNITVSVNQKKQDEDKKKKEEEEARRKAFEEAEREMLEDMKRMEDQEKADKKKKEEEEARRKAFEEAEREMLEDMKKMEEQEKADKKKKEDGDDKVKKIKKLQKKKISSPELRLNIQGLGNTDSNNNDKVENSSSSSSSKKSSAPSTPRKKKKRRSKSQISTKQVLSPQKKRQEYEKQMDKNFYDTPDQFYFPKRLCRIDSKTMKSIYLTELPTRQFNIMEKLGQGAYGWVYKALDKKSGDLVAIKAIPLDTEHDPISRKLATELFVLSSLNDCSSIISYLGSYLTEHELWVVLEFCDAGSIGELVTKSNLPLDESHLAACILPVVQALDHIHKSNMIHRDIKGENILVLSDGRVKLADFGVACCTSGHFPLHQNKRNSVAGSPYWMAPELINGDIEPESSVDIWSLGITMIQLLDKVPPFYDYLPVRVSTLTNLFVITSLNVIDFYEDIF